MAERKPRRSSRKAATAKPKTSAKTTVSGSWTKTKNAKSEPVMECDHCGAQFAITGETDGKDEVAAHVGNFHPSVATAGERKTIKSVADDGEAKRAAAAAARAEAERLEREADEAPGIASTPEPTE